VLQVDASQLVCLNGILNTFADSTSLKVNYNKSCMMPINMDEEMLSHFYNTLQCRKGTLTFTYLGLSLGITKPMLDFFPPMVQRVERRLCGIADFLDYGWKLLMVKSVLASLPIYYMSCLDIPITINNHVAHI
jgi:hypothetical protein